LQRFSRLLDAAYVLGLAESKPFEGIKRDA
jgi:hypothetical protein